MSVGKIISANKKAYHDFEILETFQAGMVLTGTEIKSIRAGKINLKDSFAKVENNEIWLYNAHISPYEKGNIYNHEPERKRKLLLTSEEIKKISSKVKELSYTIVPTKIYISRGWAKIEIGLGKGKKLYDKRDSIAKKTQKRDIERELKNRY